MFLPEQDDEGLTPKEFFHKMDSIGLKKMEGMKCTEPEIVREVLKFKKGLNFHIKMWVEGYDDMMMGIGEYLEMFTDPPDWVEKGFRNQLERRLR